MTRRRTFVVLSTLAALAVIAVALSRHSGKTPAPPSDGLAAPGIFRSRSFRVRLSGPLWQARSVQDRDGVDDFAIVADDLPLDIGVRTTGGARVGSVELRVDGRGQRVWTPHCGQAGCPAELGVRLTPRLRGIAAGGHHVQVYVRGAGAHVARRPAAFEVRTAATVPAAVEGEPTRKGPPLGAPRGDTRLARAGLAVLAAERSRPGLAAALSRARVSVIQAGPLNARERPIGVTLWVALNAPLRDVRATVPAYVPTNAPAGPSYTPQSVRMHVAVLRDALIDVDLTTRRVIALEPGPRSKTLSWKPSQAPAPAGTGDEN